MQVLFDRGEQERFSFRRREYPASRSSCKISYSTALVLCGCRLPYCLAGAFEREEFLALLVCVLSKYYYNNNIFLALLVVVVVAICRYTAPPTLLHLLLRRSPPRLRAKSEREREKIFFLRIFFFPSL